ncbi:MAG: CDP-alcohol phosphatidyltransferase family protein [Anaerolineae bacterium]
MTHHKRQPLPRIAVIPIAGGAEGGAGAAIRLCGMPVIERLLRTLRAIGPRDVVIIARNPAQEWPQSVRSGVERLGLSVDVVNSECNAASLGLTPDQRVLVVESDYVLDRRILHTLLAQPEECVVVYDSQPLSTQAVPVAVEGGRLQAIGTGLATTNGGYAGATVCPARMLGVPREWGERGWVGQLSKLAQTHPVSALDIAAIDPYIPGSRRAVRPLWFHIRTPADARRCKDALVESAQKGTLDVIAWYIHRPIENWIVHHIADLPVTPNQVSALTSLVGFAVAALFLSGNLLPGVLLALVVNVMDGLDGKLARVKGLTSKLGELEHSLDCLYEQAWYAGFAWGIYRLTGSLLPLALGTVMLLCDSFARHVSMQFKQVTGISMADYAPFDQAFRRFDGRRNTYSLHLLLSILLGMPLVASFTMALHAAITAAVYTIQAALHLRRADQGHGHWR